MRGETESVSGAGIFNHFCRAAFGCCTVVVLLAPCTGIVAQDIPILRIMHERFILQDLLSTQDLTPAIAWGMQHKFSPAVLVVPKRVGESANKDTEEMHELKDGIYRISGELLCRCTLADLLSSLYRRWLGTNSAPAVLLDLRGVACHQSWEEAAKVASFFIQPGIELYAIKTSLGEIDVFTSQETPLLMQKPPLAVLVDEETSGVPELLALLLAQHSAAVIFGKTTAGAPYRYYSLDLDETYSLLIADAMIVLPMQPDKPIQAVVPHQTALDSAQQVAEDYLRAASVISSSVLASEAD